MKIYLLIYVIQSATAHQPMDVQKIEQPSLAACYMRQVEVPRQLHAQECVKDQPCWAPFLVRTACVEGE
jgi:hypothetical protein